MGIQIVNTLWWDYPFAKGHTEPPQVAVACLNSDRHQNSSQGFHSQEQVAMSSQDSPEEKKAVGGRHLLLVSYFIYGTVA